MSRSTKLGLLATALALVVVACVVEAGLWIIAPVENPFEPPATHQDSERFFRLEYPRNYAARTVVNETLPGMGGEGRFTTNNYGFRGGELVVPKPAREFRVFLVGGSTVECFYIDDDDELGSVLQTDLAAHVPEGSVTRIYNVGLSGASSDDHVSMIAQRLMHLEPDLLVVMCGVNDLLRAMRGLDYLHYPRPVQRIPRFSRLCASSQIGRRLIYFKRRVRPEPRRVQEARTLASRYHRRVQLQREAAETGDPPLTDIAPYRRNLRTIVGTARANSVGLVFVTHPHTWNSRVDPDISQLHWMRRVGSVRYSEDLMAAAMEAMNLTMLEAARDRAVPLYDLATGIETSTRYFYDDCHLNRDGAQTVALGLSEFLRTNGLVPTADR